MAPSTPPDDSDPATPSDTPLVHRDGQPAPARASQEGLKTLGENQRKLHEALKELRAEHQEHRHEIRTFIKRQMLATEQPKAAPAKSWQWINLGIITAIFVLSLIILVVGLSKPPVVSQVQSSVTLEQMREELKALPKPSNEIPGLKEIQKSVRDVADKKTPEPLTKDEITTAVKVALEGFQAKISDEQLKPLVELLKKIDAKPQPKVEGNLPPEQMKAMLQELVKSPEFKALVPTTGLLTATEFDARLKKLTADLAAQPKPTLAPARKEAVDMAIVLINSPRFRGTSYIDAVKRQLKEFPNSDKLRTGFYVAHGRDLEMRIELKSGKVDKPDLAWRDREADSSSSDEAAAIGVDLAAQFDPAQANRHAILVAGIHTPPPRPDQEGWSDVRRVDVILVRPANAEKQKPSINEWLDFCATHNGQLILVAEKDTASTTERLVQHFRRLCQP